MLAYKSLHFQGKGLLYGGQEHANADGLGGARHIGGSVVVAGLNEGRWSGEELRRDA
jgi:hypothetical protein